MPCLRYNRSNLKNEEGTCNLSMLLCVATARCMQAADGPPRVSIVRAYCVNVRGRMQLLRSFRCKVFNAPTERSLSYTARCVCGEKCAVCDLRKFVLAAA
jgi:hypothetical protein